MEHVDLKLECDYIGQIETSYQDTQLKVSLKNVNEHSLILEFLDNVDIEKLLMHIDSETLQKELKRKKDED